MLKGQHFINKFIFILANNVVCKCYNDFSDYKTLLPSKIQGLF